MSGSSDTCNATAASSACWLASVSTRTEAALRAVACTRAGLIWRSAARPQCLRVDGPRR